MRIAEIGLCHDGNFDYALELIRLAKANQFDVVKFQKRSAGKWFNDPTPRPDSPFGKTLGEHRHKLEFTPGQHKVLQEYAHKLDLKYGCSVWDPTAAREIFKLIQPGDILKIGRPSNAEIDLLNYLKGLYQKTPSKLTSPLVVSCRNEEEVELIREIFGDLTGLQLDILFCPGNYPDRLKDLPTELPSWASGISLHHQDPLFGAALSARIIERHIATERTQHRDKQWSLLLK